MINGEIIVIEKMFDTATCRYYYSCTIVFNDVPKLILGNCEVKQ